VERGIDWLSWSSRCEDENAEARSCRGHNPSREARGEKTGNGAVDGVLEMLGIAANCCEERCRYISVGRWVADIQITTWFP
jgi:hypothetical protein